MAKVNINPIFYDPLKTKLFVDNELVTGFTPGNKILIDKNTITVNLQSTSQGLRFFVERVEHPLINIKLNIDGGNGYYAFVYSCDILSIKPGIINSEIPSLSTVFRILRDVNVSYHAY